MSDDAEAQMRQFLLNALSVYLINDRVECFVCAYPLTAHPYHIGTMEVDGDKHIRHAHLNVLLGILITDRV